MGSTSGRDAASGPRPMPSGDLARLIADPHGVYRQCRAEGPVVSFLPRVAHVLHARNVMRLVSDPRTPTLPGALLVEMTGIQDGVTAEFLKTSMLLSEGSDHQRRRGSVSRIFSQPVMKAQRQRIRALIDRIVSEAPRGEPFDYVESIASLVPAETIANILGLPIADVPTFRRRVYSFSRCLSPPYPIDAHEDIEAAGRALFDYVQDELESRRRAPRDDLLSALVEMEAAGGLERRDLAFQVLTLILAGSDTTRAAIAMTMSLLLQHPDQWSQVKADPSLVPGAVAEALRFEPPVGSFPRFAVEPVEVDGFEIPGQFHISLATLSAMRDEEAYPDPDRFDVTRTGGPRLHMVFGGGAHRCLGEMLARIELEETLSAVIAAAPDLELIEPARMSGFGGIRKVSPMTTRIPA